MRATLLCLVGLVATACAETVAIDAKSAAQENLGFSELVAEAVATTRRLAARSQSAAVSEVASLAGAHAALAATRPGSHCPLDAAADIVLDSSPMPIAETLSLVDRFRKSLDDLCWFRNTAVPQEFYSTAAAAELIGPDGAIDADDLRFGFFIIGPDANYVRHWHSAEELYMVLSGTAEWNFDDGWTARVPGDVVHIPSLTPHALRTTTSPVLMLYSWTGDITFETYGHGH